MQNIIIFTIVMTLILSFFGVSLYLIFTFETPYCYAGIPGTLLLGYIIGDWTLDKIQQK